jgi:hypothetical protein
MSDSNQIIAASIQVDTGNSQESVGSLNKETSKLKNTLGDVGATNKKTGESFANIKAHIAGVDGPTKQLTGSSNALNQAWNFLKANPILGIFALLAGIVVALFDKFKKMEGVSDSLGKAWGTLSGLFSTFLNKILTPLIDAFTFFVGLFTKAATFIAGIFSPSLAEAAKRSGELAEALDDLNDAEAKATLTRAESNRKLQEAREAAEDANIPIQERIKYLREAGIIENQEIENSINLARKRTQIILEQLALEAGAQQDVIDKIRNGSIENLKIARDALYELKNIDKSKLEKPDDLLKSIEDQGAQRAKISKKTESQITSLEKEEEGKRKEARDKAAAAQKEQEQKLSEFRSKYKQLQQENELSSIKDGYQKELRQLEIKLENEKALNAKGVKERRLSGYQANVLNIELEKQYNIKKNEATEKHNKEVADKEKAFQMNLAKLRQEITLGGIVDSRQLEKEQLKINYLQALNEAKNQYADDQAKFIEFKLLLDEKNRQDQNKLQAKIDAEDKKAKEDRVKKVLEDKLKKGDEVLSDPDASIKAKVAALDAEVQANQDAFNRKEITEEIYNDNIKKFALARMAIRKEEQQHTEQITSAIGTTLGNLSTIAGKQTLLGKAFAVAQTTIDTYQSAIAAFKSLAGIPIVGPALGGIAAAAAIKNGIDAVKQITSVKVPGSAGTTAGGPIAPSPSITPIAPLTPKQQGAKVIGSDAGNAAAGGVDRVIRAYVVDADVQGSADRNARLNRAARLGG